MKQKTIKLSLGLGLTAVGIIVMALNLFGEDSILIGIIIGGFGLVLIGTSAISAKK